MVQGFRFRGDQDINLTAPDRCPETLQLGSFVLGAAFALLQNQSNTIAVFPGVVLTTLGLSVVVVDQFTLLVTFGPGIDDGA